MRVPALPPPDPDDDEPPPPPPSPELMRRLQSAKRAYQPHYADLARNYAMLGCNDLQIARLLRTTPDRVMLWRRLFEDFDAMIEAGRERSMGEVANALYQRAVGFSRPGERVFTHKLRTADGGEYVEVTRVPVMEYYPPDVAAASRFLEQRAGWQTQTTVHHDGAIEVKGGGISALLALAEGRVPPTVDGELSDAPLAPPAPAR